MRRSVSTVARVTAALLSRVYIGFIGSLILWAVAPMLLGWTPTIVTSGSMEPLIHTGDIVVAKPISQEDVKTGSVKVGQVLLANNPVHPGDWITHRVHEVRPDGQFITKGDANAQPDSTPLPAESVSGIECLRIPYIGIPVDQLRKGNPIPAALFVVLSTLALLALRMDSKKAQGRRKAKSGEAEVSALSGAQKTVRARPGKQTKIVAGTAGLLALILSLLGGSSAAFSGTTSNASNVFTTPATFTNPAISTKLMKFGVTEPGATTAELDKVSREVGEYPSISQWYADWESTLDMPKIQATLAKGVTPMITWEPWSGANATINQPTYKLSTITSGAHDAYLLSVTNQLKAAGNPNVMIRFAHEMNGNWYPWSEQVNGNAAGDYAKAWKHVVDYFNAQGVTNVEWVWSPNIPYTGSTGIAGLYPGTAYVHHTALDGFNWGSFQSPFTWVRPWDLLGAGLGAIQYVAPDKNIIVAETASTETEGANTKATWIADMVYYLNHWGDGKGGIRISALVWFDTNKETNWRIDSSPASMNAMKSALAAR